ncbi:unnamed protein product [Laminaria digitata]
MVVKVFGLYYVLLWIVSERFSGVITLLVYLPWVHVRRPFYEPFPKPVLHRYVIKYWCVRFTPTAAASVFFFHGSFVPLAQQQQQQQQLLRRFNASPGFHILSTHVWQQGLRRSCRPRLSCVGPDVSSFKNSPTSLGTNYLEFVGIHFAVKGSTRLPLASS